MKSDLQLSREKYIILDTFLGKLRLEFSPDEFTWDIEHLKCEKDDKVTPIYCIGLKETRVEVFIEKKGKKTFIFSQDRKTNATSKKTSRRHETLIQQHNSSQIDTYWHEVLEKLEKKHLEWIFPFMLHPETIDGTHFARMFGFNSFFYRWFVNLPKKTNKVMISRWRSYFEPIYHDTTLKDELYWTHAYITFIYSHIIESLGVPYYPNLIDSFPLLSKMKKS